MKIAHVTFMSGMSPGVQNRIIGMAQGLRSLNRSEDVDFFFLNNKKDARDEAVRFVLFKERYFPLHFYDRLFHRFDLIEKNIDLRSYDYIILRYPKADASGIDFMTRYKVITEHHTLELQYSKSFLNSNISSWLRITKKVRLKQESDYGQRILKNATGIIGVTDEIRKFELTRAGRNIPSVAISNGILVNRINLTGFKLFEGRSINLVMLVSSSYPWNGLDRIISGINQYKGGVDIRLHLIGGLKKNDIKYVGLDLSKVRFHGFQTGRSLDKLLKEMNLAIGPLALHRVGMSEACTLKIREYTARGIPFVLAYKDTDLSHVDVSDKFYLECENSDRPFDMDQVICFAEKMSRKGKAVSECMRNYAQKHMDWSSKMDQYIDFVKQIDNGRRPFNF